MLIIELIFLPLDTWKIYNLQNLTDLWVVDKGQVTQNHLLHLWELTWTWLRARMLQCILQTGLQSLGTLGRHHTNTTVTLCFTSVVYFTLDYVATVGFLYRGVALNSFPLRNFRRVTRIKKMSPEAPSTSRWVANGWNFAFGQTCFPFAQTEDSIGPLFGCLNKTELYRQRCTN